MKAKLELLVLSLSLILILGCTTCTATEYDLIVVGSDPEGIMAAVSGARKGLRTIVISKDPIVGGLMTLGGLNSIDMNYGLKGEVLTRGMFTEFFNQIEGDSFDIKTAENVFLKMIQEANVDIILNVDDFKPIVNKSKVIGVTYVKDGKSNSVLSLTTIDATADAEVAYQAGIGFTIGMEDYGGPAYGMGATLIFGVAGVSWEDMGIALRRANRAHTGITNVSAWGFWDEMQGYKPKDPYIRFRGLNIGRQNDNTVLINTMYIFDFIHLSPVSRIKARQRGIEELQHLIPYMRTAVPGFQNATLSHICETLYIRETRHMLGLYRLSIDDVLEHRDFPDKIALGSYPVDIQDISLTQRGYVVGTPKTYSIPFRCIVPKDIDGILVTSRSASYDSLPHGSARVIPVGMVVSEAAGIAAYLKSKQPEIPWQTLATDNNFVNSLQALLKEQGAYLPKFEIPAPITNHWAYPAIKKIRALGLTATGYNNDYKLEEVITGLAWQNLFNAALTYKFGGKFPYCYSTTEGNITLKHVAELFLISLNISIKQDVIKKALELNLFPASLPQETYQATSLKRDTVYYLLAHFLDHLSETTK